MRIVSLIPSITETLMTCGANVVGRSRFCIHPQAGIENVPEVAGTKDVAWQRVAAVRPDLVILDREENTREMAESCPFPYLALHINHIDEVGPELEKVAVRLESTKLQQIAAQWERIAMAPDKSLPSFFEIPGMVSWWRRPTTESRLEYLIWRDPWMAIGDNTFIGSVLDKLGAGVYKVRHRSKYPEIDLDCYRAGRDCLLFSTEPYPFARYRLELSRLGFACGLIDGESYSWYGIRSMKFLLQRLGI